MINYCKQIKFFIYNTNVILPKIFFVKKKYKKTKKNYFYSSIGGKISIIFIFLFKNISWRRKLESKRVRRTDIWLPVSEKSHSLGTEVAGIAKYLRANFDKLEKIFSRIFHHSHLNQQFFDLDNFLIHLQLHFHLIKY